jgi:hypothetical protein
MALKVWDGLDHYKDKDDWLARSGFLQYAQPITNASPIAFVTGRNGQGKAMNISQGNTPTYAVFQDRNKSAFVGFACLFDQNTGATFAFDDTIGNGVVYSAANGTLTFSTNTQINVYFNPVNYSILVSRGPLQFLSSGNYYTGNLLYASGNNAWVSDVWNFIEIWVDVDPSAGFVKVWLNNVQKVNLTGANTQVTANAWWDRLSILPVGDAGSPDLTIDDFYYGDTTTGPGTFPGNAPIGDCHVNTLFAVGNDSVQWTPLALTNWQEVCELAMDSDTTYNFSSTVGQEDLLNFNALPVSTTLVFGVQVTGAYRKDDSGSRFIKQALKSNVTEQYGVNYSLSEVNYVYFTDQWILDPDTSANWTVTGVNSLAAGYNVEA